MPDIVLVTHLTRIQRLKTPVSDPYVHFYLLLLLRIAYVGSTYPYLYIKILVNLLRTDKLHMHSLQLADLSVNRTPR